MKIAYVLNTYPEPSHSFIRREIRSIEAMGHEVLRFAMRKPEVTLVDAQDRAERDKTEYVLAEGGGTLLRAGAGALRRDAAGFREALAAAWRLSRASEAGLFRHLVYVAEAAFIAQRCRDENVDHVHAHFGTNPAAVAMLCTMLGGPKYSFTVHGPEEFDAPRALSLGTKMARADFTVAISSFGRSQLRRWADPSDWERIEVVHCGIEPERFADPTPLSKGPRGVVAIGRLVEQKGQLALIEAMARTSEHMHLTLIGDGGMRGQIEARIAALRLKDRITMPGWADEARVRAELDAAHALVMPSFAEGLPMVVMEAMAAGLPVIATYVAGTPELVQDGRTGWLVPAGDVDALAGALDEMARAPLAKLSKMGAAGRARVLERHDVNREAERLVGLMQG